MKELLELEHVKDAYIRYITKLELKQNENTSMLFLKDFIVYYYTVIQKRFTSKDFNSELKIIKEDKYKTISLQIRSSLSNTNCVYIFSFEEDSSMFNENINTLNLFMNYYAI